MYEGRYDVVMFVGGEVDNDNRVLRARSAISESGLSVLIVALSKKKSRNPEFVSTVLRVADKRCMTRRICSLLDMLRYYRASKKILRIHRPMFVHCHDYDTLLLGMYAKKVCGAKVIYDNHEFIQDIRYLHRYPWLLRMSIAKYEMHCVKRIDGFICVSQGIAAWYSDRTSVKPIVVRNIPIRRGSEQEMSDTSIEQMLSRSCRSGKKLLLYMGNNLMRGRGLDLIIKLLNALGEPWELHVFGDYQERAKRDLETRFMADDLADRIHINNRLPLSVILGLGKYFEFGLSLIEPIYYSYKYALPNKLFEYIHMGIPVISTDIPEQAALIKQYNVGVIIYNGEVETAVREIRCSAYSEKNFQNAKRNLSWESEKMKLINLYDQIMA